MKINKLKPLEGAIQDKEIPSDKILKEDDNERKN